MTAGGGDPKLNRQLAKVLDAGLQQGVQKTRLNEMLEKAVSIDVLKGHIVIVLPSNCLQICQI